MTRPHLTPRRVECLQHAAEGYTNDEIAARLGIETESVKSHLQLAYRTLQARSRAHAVTLAVAHGYLWIRPDGTVATTQSPARPACVDADPVTLRLIRDGDQPDPLFPVQVATA